MNIESNLYFYKALVKRVVDGDTIRADIDWGNKYGPIMKILDFQELILMRQD